VEYDAEGYGSDDLGAGHLDACDDEEGHSHEDPPAATTTTTPLDSLQSLGSKSSDDNGGSTPPSPGHWSCKACTYHNPIGKRMCVVCGAKKGGSPLC